MLLLICVKIFYPSYSCDLLPILYSCTFYPIAHFALQCTVSQSIIPQSSLLSLIIPPSITIHCYPFISSVHQCFPLSTSSSTSLSTSTSTSSPTSSSPSITIHCNQFISGARLLLHPLNLFSAPLLCFPPLIPPPSRLGGRR